MAHASEPGFLVLHGLRLKGFAAPPALAAVVDLPADDVTAALDKLQAEGLVQYREGRITGWSLTPSGRARHAERCGDELVAIGCKAVIDQAYRRFLAVNEPFLEVCTDWQLRTGPDGSQAINDHGDPDHDVAVLGRLREIHVAVEPICADLSGAMSRYAAYQPRLCDALQKVEDGEREWFTGALIESYHTVWFELHEDLLATLGIARDSEGSR
jgi:DNA-binding MarR family transcriptional regulator